MDDIIVTLRFSDIGAARRALQMLKLLDSEGQLRVRAAALVERSGQRSGPPGRAADGASVFLAQGGVVGMLVDGLSSPLGAVFARPTESFLRHGKPSPHEDEHELAVSEISRNLEPGVTLVIAEIEDPDPDVLDAAFAALGGTATRRAADAFSAELGAAGRR